MTATGAVTVDREQMNLVRSRSKSHSRSLSNASKARPSIPLTPGQVSSASTWSVDEKGEGRFGGDGNGHNDPAELIVEEDKEVCCSRGGVFLRGQEHFLDCEGR